VDKLSTPALAGKCYEYICIRSSAGKLTKPTSSNPAREITPPYTSMFASRCQHIFEATTLAIACAVPHLMAYAPPAGLIQKREIRRVSLSGPPLYQFQTNHKSRFKNKLANWF